MKIVGQKKNRWISRDAMIVAVFDRPLGENEKLIVTLQISSSNREESRDETTSSNRLAKMRASLDRPSRTGQLNQ